MRDRIIRLRAWAMGLRDGYRDGSSFSSGITWSDGPWLAAGANDAYDMGVNTGQALRTVRTFGAEIHSA